MELNAPIEHINSRNVYPFFVDYENNYIYFIETQDAIQHNSVSFFYEELQKKARYLVTVRIDDFISMWGTRPLTDGSGILFIHHPGRCGSTLLHKLLGSHSEIESFSEDLIFENALKKTNSHASRHLFKTVISFLKAKFSASPGSILSYKLSGHSDVWFNELIDLLPKAKHIYISRDSIKICESMNNMLRRNVFWRIAAKLRFYNMKIIPYSKNKMIGPRYRDPYYSCRTINAQTRPFKISLAEAVIMSVSIKDYFFSSQGERAEILKLRYDDIISKTTLCSAIGNFLNLNLSQELDWKLYGAHSQKSSIADYSKHGHHRFTRREVARLRAFRLAMSKGVTNP